MTSIEIPNSVTSIGGGAFSGCTGLTSIIIPNSVTSIGNYAFDGCTGLTSIEIPNSVTHIGSRAFQGCTGLTSVSIDCSNIGEWFQNLTSIKEITFGEHVSNFNDYAFSGCTGLTSIIIGKGVTYINSSIFRDCTELTSVSFDCSNIGSWFNGRTSIKEITLGEYVTSIGGGAFSGCTGLTSIEIPNSVTSIGGGAFSGCTGLTSILIPNSVTSLSGFTGCTGLTSIEIPNSVTSIGPSAFWDCTGLTSIIIPNSVTSIGDNAFRGCTGLKSINIPNSVTSIGNSAFDGCTGLTSITLDCSHIGSWVSGLTSIKDITLGEHVTSIGNHAFNNFTELTSVSFDCSNIGSWFIGRSSIKEITLGEHVTTIGSQAFTGCTGLTSVVIGNNVTIIDRSAFEGCSGLTSIEIPNSVTSIGSEAFRGCTGLTSVTLDCSNIGSWFVGLKSIKEITLGEHVTTIGNGAFGSNTELTSIVVAEKNKTYDSRNNCYAIIETNTNTLICGCKSTTIPNSVTTIGDWAFCGCTGLTSIEIPNSVISIGGHAFRGCTGLKSINIPNSVTSIDEYAFYGCTGLPSIEIPNSVTSIGSNAFYGCSGLTSIEIPNGVEDIGSNAFDGCTYLTRIKYHSKTIKMAYAGNTIQVVIIGDDVENITASAFDQCSALKKVIIEDGDKTLKFGGVAFYRSPIDSVYLGRNISFPNNNAPFSRNKEGLTKLIIGPKVTDIPANAFSGHSGLKTLQLSEGLKKIGINAFYGCKGIESLSIPSSVDEIGNNAFNMCTSIANLKIEDGNTELLFSRESTNSVINTFSNSPLTEIYMGRNFGYQGNTSPFMGIYSLKTIRFGKNVTNIQSKSFIACKDMTDVYCIPSTVPITGEYIFTDTYLPNATLHTPHTLFKTYGKSNPWNLFGRLFAIMEDGQEKEAFKVTYLLNNQEYATDFELQGNALNPPEVMSQEGYTFSGWMDLPESMPGMSLVITGNMTANKYKMTYIVDGIEYKTVEIEYGSAITPESTLTKEGYTFSGWSEIPATMPAHDVSVTGTFAINKYKLSYIVDGSIYKSSEIEYASAITPESTLIKEGYTFSGWSEIPATMPAHDVTITGSFTINKYKVTYMVDATEYKSTEIEYGEIISPEPSPTKEGYTFSGWSEIPETMPAHDITITGSFAANKYKITYMVDGVIYKTYEVEYGSSITAEESPTKEGYTFSGWSNIPETMPNHDMTITGTFSKGAYKVIYMVDGAEFKTVSYDFEAVITPEVEPTKQGYTFSGWQDLPGEMPAHDVTIMGVFTKGVIKYDFSLNGINYKLNKASNSSIVVSGEENLSGFVSIPDKISYDGVEYTIISIIDSAFFKCSNMTSISIPNSVMNIDKSVFANCEGLTSVIIEDGDDMLNIYGENGEYLPFGDLAIKTVYIGRSIEYGENYFPFQEMSSLKEVKIGSKVKSLGTTPFFYCLGITSIVVDPLNPVYDSRDNCNAVIETATNTLIAGCENTVIPNSVVSIGRYAFAGREGMTLIELPSSVTQIGYAAFGYCSSLVSVNIPNSTTQIDKYAFYQCSGLKSITLPESINTIEEGTFAECSSLLSVELPNGLTNIGYGAFIGCSDLKTIKIGRELQSIGPGAFQKCKSLKDVYCYAKNRPATPTNTFLESSIASATLHVPSSLINEYRATAPWNGFGSIVSLPQHKLIYVVDGREYKVTEIEEYTTIIAEAEPTKEGYTFSGWTDLPETMPAHDVTVTGSFIINKYKITYVVDGKEYGTSEVVYGAEVNPIEEPSKEGYTFSGWLDLPEEMPAHDVTVTGTFTVNKYKVTFMYGDNVLTTIEVNYGEAIELPESLNSERYTLIEWKDVPESMPAHDVVIYADYVDGINTITADSKNEQYIRINGMYTNELKQGVNIIRTQDGKTRKVWVK